MAILEADLSDALRAWREERRSAWLYRKLSDRESGTPLQLLFLELAAAADRQADMWRSVVVAQGRQLPDFSPGWRAYLAARLLCWFEPRSLRPLLASMKVRGLSVYTDSHAATERRHSPLSGAHDLRAVVFGMNDGLVSNLALMFGVAGASGAVDAALLAGAAGLLAGSLSMAAGEYISVRAQRELHESQIALERAELDHYPEEEAGELAAIFVARGMTPAQARSLADGLVADPDLALQTLAREELGLDPQALASPWRAAVASFLAFAVGAAVPLLPLLLVVPGHALLASAAASAVALIAFGAAVALFSGQDVVPASARMLLIGAGAALATWLIGSALGVAVA